ncbi:hypothetical protein MMC25_001973 [Agyrium rufum]|nr:hypothetical protein [Agyrium rufum]
MPGTRELIPPRQKRQRSEAGLSNDDSSQPRPAKRRKSSIKFHSAEFYDSLSKVWLARRALKEVDRRASPIRCPQRPVSELRDAYRAIPSKQIQSFARHGGPDLRDLRGIRNRKSKPGLEGFHEALRRPRPSLSPSRFPDDAFEEFQQTNEDVIDEGDVMRNVVPTICGNADIPSRQNLLFTRLDPIANDTTVDAKPDFYDGARLEDIDKLVQHDLGSYIIPTGQHMIAPVAPNFFLEVKRPSGGANVAKRQACYSDALGARGMHQLQLYKREPIYDGNAYTITSTYHDGNLNMYVTHVTSSGSGDSSEYYMS